MSKPNTAVTPDTRTLDRLLGEFRELHAGVGSNLVKLAKAPRFSDAYHDTLAVLYSQLTLAKFLAEELQTEMDRLDDQLPEDLSNSAYLKGKICAAAEGKGESFMSDDLFRLGWLENTDLGLASRCLTTLADKAAQYKDAGVFEDDTRAIFVEPLLRGLGWDTFDHGQVDREYPRGEGKMIGDIWLGGFDYQKKWKIAVVLEVKSLDSSRARMRVAYEQLRGDVLDNLFSGSTNEQFRLYFDDKPFVRGIVTNGRSWTVYNFDPSVPEEHKPICEFDLQAGSDNKAEFIQWTAKRYVFKELGLSEH